MVGLTFASWKIGSEKRNRNERKPANQVWSLIRRGSQVVRPRSAKPLLTGSIPVPASLQPPELIHGVFGVLKKTKLRIK